MAFLWGENISMQEYAKSFYKSKAWEKCRRSYIKFVGGLCENCLQKGIVNPATMVHHKIYITPENIRDASITLSFANLQALCRQCHADIHAGKERRYTVDELGRVSPR